MYLDAAALINMMNQAMAILSGSKMTEVHLMHLLQMSNCCHFTSNLYHKFLIWLV